MQGAKEGCDIMHVVSRTKGAVNISNLALHKCAGMTTTIRSSAVSEMSTEAAAATPTTEGTSNQEQMDVLTKRLAEKEESERIASEEKQALIDELAKTKNENKRFREHEEQRMTDMKNDWIDTLKEMFKKNGDNVPNEFENSINSLSETQHQPFVEVMCSVTKYQKSTGREIEELRGQLETERNQNKQMSEKNLQKDGTIQALRTVQNTRAAVAEPSKDGVFASHQTRFQSLGSHLPKMGEFGRVMPQPPGNGMKEKFPELFNSIMASADTQKGMDMIPPLSARA